MDRSLSALVLMLMPLSTMASEFLGKTSQEWARDLLSAQPSVRRSAAFALGKLGPFAARSIPQLAQRLNDKAPEVREMAAHALGEIAQNSLLDARTVWAYAGDLLQKLLVNEQGPQGIKGRRSAAYAIGSCKRFAGSARGSLIEALKKDASPVVRRNAAWALGQMGSSDSEGSVQALCETLQRQGENASVLRDAALSLGEIGRPTAQVSVRPLLALVKSKPDGVVLKTALATLAKLIDPADNIEADGLEPLLDHRDFEVKLSAAFVIANSGGQLRKVLPILLKELRNGTPQTRELVTAALANVGQEAAPAVEDLIKVLNDKKNSDRTRRNAAVALANVGRQAAPAVDALAVILDPRAGEPVELRLYAAEGLTMIGHPANISAKDQMLSTLKDAKEHPLIRTRIVWAMMKVPDLKRYGAVDALAATLSETDYEGKDVRYNAAILLGKRLRADAPDKTVDVLEEILRDEKFRIYEKTEAKVSGGGEGKQGGSDINAKFGRDARFVAAEALMMIGKKSAQPKVLRSLEALKDAEDDRVRDKAREALDALRP